VDGGYHHLTGVGARVRLLDVLDLQLVGGRIGIVTQREARILDDQRGARGQKDGITVRLQEKHIVLFGILNRAVELHGSANILDLLLRDVGYGGRALGQRLLDENGQEQGAPHAV